MCHPERSQGPRTSPQSLLVTNSPGNSAHKYLFGMPFSFGLTRKRKSLLLAHRPSQRHQKGALSSRRKHRRTQIRMTPRNLRSLLLSLILVVISKRNHRATDHGCPPWSAAAAATGPAAATPVADSAHPLPSAHPAEQPPQEQRHSAHSDRLCRKYQPSKTIGTQSPHHKQFPVHQALAALSHERSNPSRYRRRRPNESPQPRLASTGASRPEPPPRRRATGATEACRTGAAAKAVFPSRRRTNLRQAPLPAHSLPHNLIKRRRQRQIPLASSALLLGQRLQQHRGVIMHILPSSSAPFFTFRSLPNAVAPQLDRLTHRQHILRHHMLMHKSIRMQRPDRCQQTRRKLLSSPASVSRRSLTIRQDSHPPAPSPHTPAKSHPPQLMPKILQLHQIRMVQRRHPAPPRQYVIAIEVRFDQPYHRRRTRAIRRGEKRAPALRPYQLCKWVDPINRSSFIFCPKIHGPLPSGAINQGRRNTARAKETEDHEKEHTVKAADALHQHILSFIAPPASTRSTSHRTTT